MSDVGPAWAREPVGPKWATSPAATGPKWAMAPPPAQQPGISGKLDFFEPGAPTKKLLTGAIRGGADLANFGGTARSELSRIPKESPGILGGAYDASRRAAIEGGAQNVEAGIEKMKSGSPARMLLGAGQDIVGTVQEGMSPMTGAMGAMMEFFNRLPIDPGMSGVEHAEAPKPAVRPTVADIPKAMETPPDPRAAQKGQEAVQAVADKAPARIAAALEKSKSGPLTYDDLIAAHQTPEAKAAFKQQKDPAADQGHHAAAMAQYTKEANADVTKGQVAKSGGFGPMKPLEGNVAGLVEPATKGPTWADMTKQDEKTTLPNFGKTALEALETKAKQQPTLVPMKTPGQAGSVLPGVKTAKGKKTPFGISETIPPGTPPHVEALIKKGNNFFADQFAKQSEKTTLPMDEASRAERATKLGFRTDLTLYHGTSADFIEFDPALGKNGEKAIFATDNPYIAAHYGGGKILPLWAKMQNPLVIDAKGAGSLVYSNTQMKQWIDQGVAGNHDVVIVKGLKDTGGIQTQYVFLKPENLRAKDAAVFDPKKVNSPNLLSAAAPKASGANAVPVAGKGPPPVAKYPDPAIKGLVKTLSDKLYQIQRRNDRAQIEALQKARALPPEAKALKEKLFRFQDANPHDKPTLTPEEQAIYDKHLLPEVERGHDFYIEIKKIDPKVFPKDYDPDYIHHMAKGKTPEFDVPIAQISHEPKVVYMGAKLPRTTRSLQPSNYYVVEDAKGDRRTVMLDDKGNLYLMQGKKPINVPAKDIKGEIGLGEKFAISGKDYTLKRASVGEKENATNLEYHKDPWLAVLSNNVRLEKVADALSFFKTLKADPEFMKFARRPDDPRATPSDYRPTTLPGWEGWKFDSHFSEVFDDFHNKPGEPWYEDLKSFNHGVVSTLFLTPFRHGGNVGAHWVVGSGWDWLSLPAYVREAKTTTAALIDTIQQGPYTKRMLDAGAALQAPRVVNQDFYGKLLKGLGDDMRASPKDWKWLWDKLNVKEEDIYNNWLKYSSSAMWLFNDVLMQSLVRERELKGMSFEEAIRSAEKDIPNYRINPRVIADNNAGRAVSRYLQNSLFSNFGRYNNNKFRTVSDIVLDMTKEGGTYVYKGKHARTNRTEAVGKAFVLTLLVSTFLWPLTYMIQALTGNKNDKMSPVGPAAPIDALKQGVEALGFAGTLKRLGADNDYVQASQLFQSFISMSPLVEQAMEQTAGFNPYTGQKLHSLGQRVGAAAESMNPLAIGGELASGKDTLTEELLRSTIGLRRQRKPEPARFQKQDERAVAKADHDPIVGGVDALTKEFWKAMKKVGVY